MHKEVVEEKPKVNGTPKLVKRESIISSGSMSESISKLLSKKGGKSTHSLNKKDVELISDFF